jgi:hypothetical protein
VQHGEELVTEASVQWAASTLLSRAFCLDLSSSGSSSSDGLQGGLADSTERGQQEDSSDDSWDAEEDEEEGGGEETWGVVTDLNQLPEP